MKNPLIYLPLLCLLFSCKHSNQGKYDEMASLYPAPVSVALDTVEGYILNSATGDSIQAFVNSLGISLKTGVPIKAKGKELKMVRYYYNTVPVRQPEIFPAGIPTVVSAYQNEYNKQKALNVIAINILMMLEAVRSADWKFISCLHVQPIKVSLFVNSTGISPILPNSNITTNSGICLSASNFSSYWKLHSS